MKNKFEAIIVDDERLARNVLKNLLADFPEIYVAGEAGNIESAVELIEKINPDIVFLDIQMPVNDGFELFNRIKINFHVVFVTAYDEYAIRAFEVNVLDYLLKPVKKERLQDTVKRIVGSKQAEQASERLDINDKIFLTVEGYKKFIELSEIIKISACKDYSLVYMLCGNEFKVLKTMKEWETILPEKHFARIHRSHIINCDKIVKLEPAPKSTYKIYLSDNQSPLSVSRNYAPLFKKKFKP